ncbi:MAG TPA: PKD domain-containing protein [Jiangellaceae bacterium]|nr:PKD domain-containing protein [Jiangellaceae bacterium]
MRFMRPADRHGNDRHRRRRGQSLVEFAIVLPILLFLTLVALDFGRVYLGWINLQSMSRIGANLAASNPTAWQPGGDASVKAQYQNQIRNDASATNCRLPTVGGVATAPNPTFIDTDGNGAADDIGDSASVQLSCTFALITPGIKDVLGGSIAVSASSVFPVSTGMTSLSGGGPSGSPPTAAFMGNGTFAPSSLSGTVPFTVDFRDTSGGSPTEWLWTFPDDGTMSSLQDPPDHIFQFPGTYIVTLTVRNAWGESTESMGVTVVAPTDVDFTYVASGPNAPATVNFTDASSPGGTSYDWTFGAGQGTGTGTTVSHGYSTAGSYDVTLTVTYPTGPVSTTKTISFGTPLCTVPSLNGVRRNDAQGVWTGAGFTGTVSDVPGAPSGNYIINYQSITAASQVPCSSSVTVNRT